jgi:hypothetical protein
VIEIDCAQSEDDMPSREARRTCRTLVKFSIVRLCLVDLVGLAKDRK